MPRRRVLTLVIIVLAVFLGSPVFAAEKGQTFFANVSLTRMSGLNTTYIQLVKSRWPWPQYGFVTHDGFTCGEPAPDDWGCWMVQRQPVKVWGPLGYDAWQIKTVKQPYTYTVPVQETVWVPHLRQVTTHHLVTTVAYRTVLVPQPVPITEAITTEVWTQIHPATTTIAYRTTYVPTTGWITITQRVWVGNPPPGPLGGGRWYWVPLPAWMSQWGANPFLQSYVNTPPTYSSATPPVTGGASGSGHYVLESTRLYGTYYRPVQTPYTVQVPAVYGWVPQTRTVTIWTTELVAKQQAYAVTHDVTTTQWVGGYKTETVQAVKTGVHLVAERYYGPVYGWTTEWVGPGRPNP